MMTNSKELKEQILKERLSNWSVIFSEEQSGFTVEDYRELKQAVIESVIKPNISDWQIKEISISQGIYGQQSELALIHKSARLKYDEVGLLEVDMGKVHYRCGFTSQEWAEIEQALSQSQQQPQIEQPLKSNFPLFGSSDSSSKH